MIGMLSKRVLVPCVGLLLLFPPRQRGGQVSAFTSEEKHQHVAQMPFVKRFLDAHPDQQFVIIVRTSSRGATAGT